MARSLHSRPRTRFDRFIERRISAASPKTLERYARLLSPKQTLTRSPGWAFDFPSTRADQATFARKLIWQRYRDEQIDRPVEVKWCNGLRLNLWLGNDVSWCVFVGGMYEPNELAFLVATVEPGMTVIDVGANDGLYTLVAAARVGEGGRVGEGRVLAVEPSSREFDRLLANIALNRLDNVQPFRLALYSHAGTAPLSRAESGHEGLNAIGNGIANPQVKAIGTEQVELDTLDGFVAARSLQRLDFIKLDAEGSEAHIVEGGFATIRRFKPVILLEIAPDHLASQGSTTGDLLGLFADLGYGIWIFDSEGLPRVQRHGEVLSSSIIAAPEEWSPRAGPL